MKQITAGTFLAILLFAGNVKAEGTEIKASGHERMETTLQLENWMTDEAIWNTKAASTADFTTETESALKLENWMTSDLTRIYTSTENMETENELELEAWMTNDTGWSASETATDKELALESWMTDNNIW
ncbi:hypothetical protein [Maribellus maritimus]|uniref:hypothetical protein n=1 Tax=Maribellus maritimus TaxID=2870838 RepID=UPI001EE9E743|nr:hypothetical protein [Maribellus maritimus]MCG6186558.1 hypothetical protein [Maribellus maritimus]